MANADSTDVLTTRCELDARLAELSALLRLSSVAMVGDSVVFDGETHSRAMSGLAEMADGCRDLLDKLAPRLVA